MRNIKLLGVVVSAVFTLSAIATASASAARNPEWWVNGALLAGTELILAEAESLQTLESPVTASVNCPNLRLTGHNKIWNDEDPPEPLQGGLDLETILYTGCLYNGNAVCKVRSMGAANAGEIETKPLHSRLVYLTKKAAEEENIHETGTLFTPETGEIFVELDFEGMSCPILAETRVKGSIATKNIPNPLTGLGNPLTEELNHYIEAPAPAIEKTFYNEGGVTKEAKDKLALGAVVAKYTGKARVWLCSDLNWSIQ
jgi:hypothetical protein